MSKLKYAAVFSGLALTYIVGIPLALLSRGLDWVLEWIDHLADVLNAYLDRSK